MKIDLHCHTRRYSLCASSSAEEMIEGAIAVGLDGIVFSEHDAFWPEDDLEVLRRKYPSILLLNAIEVSTIEGHLLVYGSTDVRMTPELWSLPDLLAMTEDESCFRAIAHPFRFDRDADHFTFLAGLRIDGIEVASINTDRKGSRMANELARVTGMRRIASSDAHSAENVGRYYTIFEDPIQSETDLVRALKLGRYRPSHATVVPPSVVT